MQRAIPGKKTDATSRGGREGARPGFERGAFVGRSRHPVVFVRAVVFAVFVFGALDASAEDPRDLLVVVNPSVKATSITLVQVRDIFLKTRTTWPDSTARALAVNAKNYSETRTAFRQRVLNMSEEDETRYWQKQKLIGKKGEPPEFPNPLKAVFKLKDSVCYVFRSDYREGIGRVILVIPAK